MTEPESVLQFWLGDAAKSPDHAKQQKKLWYRSSQAIDDEIKSRFSEVHAKASAGELERWLQHAESTLALVIVLDQFSRHIYRGQPGAFAQDDLALRYARACPDPSSLPVIGQIFLLHPFEHSEHLKVQQQSLEQFQHLFNSAPPEWQPMVHNFQQHAQEHHDIVAKFGRFPHRNAILSRPSTPEEQVYMAKGGKSFGQRKSK